MQMTKTAESERNARGSAVSLFYLLNCSQEVYIMLVNKIYFKGITYNEEEITKRVYKLKKFFENLAELALNDNNDFCFCNAHFYYIQSSED